MVASLAMLLRIDYDLARHALDKVSKRRLNDLEGYSLWEAAAAATALGYPVEVIRAKAYDPLTCSGMLSIWAEQWGHVFFVWNGIVFDPDGSVWRLPDYLSTRGRGAHLGELLVLQAMYDASSRQIAPGSAIAE
jgi:hypothetical protein